MKKGIYILLFSFLSFSPKAKSPTFLADCGANGGLFIDNERIIVLVTKDNFDLKRLAGFYGAIGLMGSDHMGKLFAIPNVKGKLFYKDIESDGDKIFQFRYKVTNSINHLFKFIIKIYYGMGAQGFLNREFEGGRVMVTIEEFDRPSGAYKKTLKLATIDLINCQLHAVNFQDIRNHGIQE
jgi:hypothetical protein